MTRLEGTMSADLPPTARTPSVDVASEETLLLLNRAMLVMHSVRGAAHELNNVLQMISGSAELLELNPECPASMMPKLQAIGNHTGRGRELIAAVSDMARAQPQRGRAADVAKTIEHVRQLRRFEQARGSVDLRIQVPSLPLLVRVDSLDLQLMLLNLVINAEQAVLASETKTISVAATADGDSVRISVTDSGGGPAPTERFVSTKSPQTAAGLGLPATEALAKHYGGEVRLRQADGGIEAALILPRAGV